MNKSENLLSFTVASLRLNENVKIAQYIHENGIMDLKQVHDADIVFSAVKSISFEKTFYQLRKRLETLTPVQIEILANGDLISQKQIALLAVCKCYALIQAFAVEVIREKTLLFDYQLNETDYNTFFKNKVQVYPKLEQFSDSTLKKAKQVMFLMLEQAGIIDNAATKRIQPQLLSPAVIRAIADDDTNLLKIFMFSDRDINELKF